MGDARTSIKVIKNNDYYSCAIMQPYIISPHKRDGFGNNYINKKMV
jgi:hypothetical protein